MKKILIPVLLLGSLSLSGQIRNDEVFELPEMEISDLAQRHPDSGCRRFPCAQMRLSHAHDLLGRPRMADHARRRGMERRPRRHRHHGPYRSPPVETVRIGRRSELVVRHRQAAGRPDRIHRDKGIEITRAKPLGHINALFITDANPIETPEPLDAVNEAYRQGAFIMWNHPGWPDDRCTMYDVHEQLIKEGKIHGVEVFNSAEYYPKAIDWCRDLKLAFLANSDIHSTTGDSYHPNRWDAR